jgi:hypothetical protein
MNDQTPEVVELIELSAPVVPIVMKEKPGKKKASKKKVSKKGRKLKKKYVFTDKKDCVDDVLDFGYDVFIGWWRD